MLIVLRRTVLVSVCAAALLVPSLIVQAQGDSKPRRPLPKPPSGSRGFEQGDRDSSSRLIAADLAKLVMQYREALSSASEQSVLERSARGALWQDDGKQDFKNDIAPIKDATVRLYETLIAPCRVM